MILRFRSTPLTWIRPPRFQRIQSRYRAFWITPLVRCFPGSMTAEVLRTKTNQVANLAAYHRRDYQMATVHLVRQTELLFHRRAGPMDRREMYTIISGSTIRTLIRKEIVRAAHKEWMGELYSSFSRT